MARTKTKTSDVPSFVQGPDGRWRTVWTTVADSVQPLRPINRTPTEAQRAHIAEAQRFARDMGVPLKVTGELDWTTRRFVRMFQDSFQLGAYKGVGGLVVDGDPGPKTNKAMAFCRASGFRVSEHFFYREFKTNGPQTLAADNHIILVVRELVASLERLRAHLVTIGRIAEAEGLSLASGYRSGPRNRAVGGALFSKHMSGRAVDWSSRYRITEAEARGAGFTAVGLWGRTGKFKICLHGDVRKNTFGRLIRWFYTNN